MPKTPRLGGGFKLTYRERGPSCRLLAGARQLRTHRVLEKVNYSLDECKKKVTYKAPSLPGKCCIFRNSLGHLTGPRGSSRGTWKRGRAACARFRRGKS